MFKLLILTVLVMAVTCQRGTVSRTDRWGWTLGVRGPQGFYQQFRDDGTFNRFMGGLGDWVGGVGDWMGGVGDWVGGIGSWARGFSDWMGNFGGWMSGQGGFDRPVAGSSGYMGNTYGYPTY